MTERELLSHLAVAFDAFTSAWRSPFRSEERRDEVHVLEYTRFPRVAADSGARLAFTRDLSASGMCISSDRAEPVGSLLRVAMRDPEGRPLPVRIERVVWCRPAGDGRHWIGLERVSASDGCQ
jgi:hypothetical protein